MNDEIEGLRALVRDDAVLGGVDWSPDDIPYFQEPTPFWRSYTEADSEPLDMDAAVNSALEALRREPEPWVCHHVEPFPGWARRKVEAGETEVSCPWCGTRVGLPSFGPRRPPLPDA